MVSHIELSTRTNYYNNTNNNTNSAEDVEVLLPFKFWQISFSGFREVENVKSSQHWTDRQTDD